MKRALLFFLFLFVGTSMACATQANLGTAIQVDRIASGWRDAGMMDGKHKIVPTATFVLKNVSDQKFGTVQVNAVFHQISDSKEWSSAYVASAVSDLAPGASSGPIAVKGDKGYTSDDLPDAMLRNTAFVDAKVEVHVRSGSSSWSKLGEYPIDRKLGPSATN